jgi:hypothetical protein
MLVVDGILLPYASRARDLARSRRTRLIGLVVAVVVVCGTTRWLTRPPAVVAQSDTHAEGHLAWQAIDHDTRTSWASTGQTGALDLVFRSARPVDSLHLVPSDPPSNGSALERAHVEAYLAGRVVKEIDATFAKPRLGVFEWNDVRVDAPACDRVRIEVEAFRGAGAIAEVEVRP